MTSGMLLPEREVFVSFQFIQPNGKNELATFWGGHGVHIYALRGNLDENKILISRRTLY